MRKQRIDVAAAGGLANRMRAVAAGVALAEDAGAELRVLWSVCDELMGEFGDLFEAPPVRSLPFEVRSLRGAWGRFSVLPPGKRNLFLPALLQAPKYGVRVYDNVNSEWYGEHPKELLRKVKDAGEGMGRNVLIFSGQSFYPFPEELYRNLFRFSAKVERRARELQGDMQHFDYGMHIRQTDNHLSIANSPIEVFERKIEDLLTENPKVRIFLATDSQEVKTRFGIKFGDAIRYNRRPAERSTPEGMLDAAAEMLILSRSKGIFGSYWSSYSEAAAIIGGVPLEILKTGG
ncbi:MAG: hypothetical protein K2M31_03345 [Muribaculaceae bacterium]|nr:hypothetical protein [Muribaculaceae bacterium]